MTKRRAFDFQLVATVAVLIASRLDEASVILGSWWLATAAGTFAMLLSQARTASFIATTLAVLTALLTFTNAGSVLGGGSSPLVLVLLIVATALQFVTLRGLVRDSRAWTTSAKYETQQANPWNSVDQGIDPTL